jgi:hypothetical protein
MPEPRRALFDAHLEGCAVCRAEFARFSAVWDALDSYGRTAAVELPPDFHRELLARIEREQIDRVVHGEVAWRERLGRVLFGRRSWKVAVATAAAAVLVALGICLLPHLNNTTQLNPGGVKIGGPSQTTGAVDHSLTPDRGTTPKAPEVTTGATTLATVDISADGGGTPAILLRNAGPALTTNVRVALCEVFLRPGQGFRSLDAGRPFWTGDIAQNESHRIPVDAAAWLPVGYALTGNEAMWLTVTWLSQGREETRHVFMPVRGPGSIAYGQVNVIGNVRVAELLESIAGQTGTTLIAPSVPDARIEVNLAQADVQTAIGVLTRAHHYRGYEDLGQVVELK